MFKQIADFCRAKAPVFKRIGFEVALPALCGIAWGLLAFFYQRKTGFDSIGLGFTAFFFIFFLQGQVLRVNKNVRDEETRNSVLTIEEGVQELLRLRPGQQPPPAEDPVRPPREMDGLELDRLEPDVLDSKRYFEEAERALRNGLYYSAVVVAAVGFEHALRTFGERYFDIPKRRPLGMVINKLVASGEAASFIDPLRIFARIRNGIVHGEEDSSRIKDAMAENIVWGFLNMVVELQKVAQARTRSITS